MNYFAFDTAAARYAHYRPRFHAVVIEKIVAKLALGKTLPLALDIGCGTAMSTEALLPIAERIIGSDLAAEMLAHAPCYPRVGYVQATAETQPLPAASTDLITVSLALHWFDRQRFLAEAARLLRPKGWLIAYNNGFRGQMAGNPNFEVWGRTIYLNRFPTPARQREPLTAEQAAPHGLTLVGNERYTNDITFTPAELAAYLTTQSNVIAAVELGAVTLEAVYDWLLTAVADYFSEPMAVFHFGGAIDYLQKH